jgi:predicted nuclease of predicted toxin-antitoxin system
MSPPEQAEVIQFKIDESIPVGAASLFRGAGFDCATVWDQGLSGAADAQIAEVCAAESRIVVTLDAGFGDIREYPPGSLPGVVVLRPDRPGRDTCLALIERLLQLLESGAPIANCLWVLDSRRLRIRSAE